ncbi:hypothetical protein GGQ59_002218 [Parvularcula dongshanensis]|uniref:JmjC domain-containing protein n=2 Tax=Parvularcula dongshanensis TaxID=1173995 RepID=A0A840I5Y7_9PROT|nr:hypothetical protein [Parvularcula dongshanensis]
MRGLVADWPIVAAGRRSPAALCSYIRGFDRGQPVSTAFGPPSLNGRLFYNDDVSGLNFRSNKAKLSASLDYLIEHQDDDDASALAVQSVPTRGALPGFEEANPNPILGGVEPRVWIGNKVIIAPHYDPSENIACVVAGRRRFTLFPPEQIANLYIGPFELTPAGATISMVSLEDPDLERYPRFAEAMKAAVVADLEPGDAIYVPYMWWHHVRSLGNVNVLVNYWWSDHDKARGEPRDALLHAMLAIKALPPRQRAAWRAHFDHYVFQTTGDPGAHLPEERRGIIGTLTNDAIRSIKGALATKMTRG